jgi:hypothetical protein
MDRVVYYFEDKTKRVESITEKDWLDELKRELVSFEHVKTADEAVKVFNQRCEKYSLNTRVSYLRSMI